MFRPSPQNGHMTIHRFLRVFFSWGLYPAALLVLQVICTDLAKVLFFFLVCLRRHICESLCGVFVHLWVLMFVCGPSELIFVFL